jgi:hypothetical protein
MPEIEHDTLDLRSISHLAEDARAGLDAFDAAAAGIGAAMRSSTLDADAACQLLSLLNETMKRRLDALVDALAAAPDADTRREMASRVSRSGHPLN